MDPRHSNGGQGSQGQFPGPNTGAYQPAWNSYMYAYQPPPGWNPQGFQPRGPNVPMMNPSGYAPEMNPSGYASEMNPSGYAPDAFQQGQTQTTDVPHSEADLEEVAATTGQTRARKSCSRIKLRNFNPEEEKNLVKAWLEISCDPIISTGQKRDRMWDRIMERYNSRRGTNPQRSKRSLQSHWDKIRIEVTVFAGYYADSIRENPSGMSDADKTTHAVSNFSAVLQRKFAYLHCWDLMKDAPKWQDVCARDTLTAARGEGFGEGSHAATDTVEPAEGQPSPVQSRPQTRRPMGRDSAKAAKKKANSDAGSSSSAEYAAALQDLSLKRNVLMQEEAKQRSERFQQLHSIDERRLEEMQRNNEALIQIEQSKLQLGREQHELERRRHEEARLREEKKEDERILSINLDACATPELRQYFQICQQEILEKQAARRQRSKGP